MFTSFLEMAMNDWTSLIATLGFPIACCIFLFWLNYTKDKKHKDEVDRLCELHKQEIINIQEGNKIEVQEMTKAINNNTLVLERLLAKLE